MQFNLADLPLHLLIVAWIYRRLCGVKTDSIIMNISPQLVSIADIIRVYEKAIDDLLEIPGKQRKSIKTDVSQLQYDFRDKKFLSGSGVRVWLIVMLAHLFENFVNKKWATVSHLNDRGIYDVAIMPLKKEE